MWQKKMCGGRGIEGTLEFVKVRKNVVFFFSIGPLFHATGKVAHS